MSIVSTAGIVSNGLILNLDASDPKSNRSRLTNILNQISPRGLSSGALYNFTSGTELVNIPGVGTQNCTFVDMYNDYNGGSGNCCPSPYGYGDGRPVTGSTQYTYGILYKSTNRYTHPNWMYHYEFNSSGTYLTEFGVHNVGGYSGVETHLGDDWYWSRALFTTQATAATINTGSWMYEYARYNRFHVAKVLLAAGNHLDLHPRYWPDVGVSSSRWLDTSGNNNNATIQNTPTWVNTNGGGWTVDNVGTQWFDLDSRASQVNTLEGTVGGWVRFNSITGQNYVFISYGGNGTGAGFLLQSESADANKFEFTMFGGLMTQARANLGVGSSAQYVGQDIYMIGTWDSSTVKLYINGVLQVTANKTGNTAAMPSQSYFRVSSEFNRTRGVNGNVYSVQLYNRALTASEVLQNYNATKQRFGR